MLLRHRKLDPEHLQILAQLAPTDQFFCMAENFPHLMREPKVTVIRLFIERPHLFKQMKNL